MAFEDEKALGGRKNGTLAGSLRELRLRAGYSQQNIADLLNVSRSAYTYYEMGKTSPDPSTLYRISKMLGVSMEVFFEEEDSQLCLSDSKPVSTRSSKKVGLNPQKIGELSSGEREVIGYLREKELQPEAVLAALRGRFDEKVDGTS